MTADLRAVHLLIYGSEPIDKHFYCFGLSRELQLSLSKEISHYSLVTIAPTTHAAERGCLQLNMELVCVALWDVGCLPRQPCQTLIHKKSIIPTRD